MYFILLLPVFRKFLPSNWCCTLDSNVRDCFVSPNESRKSRSTDLLLEIYKAANTRVVYRNSNLQSFRDAGRCFLWKFGHYLREVSCLISYKKRSKMHIFHVCIWATLLNPSLDTSCVWWDFDRASSLICGNKMPARCNRVFYCRSYCLLNMFRAPLCPSSGAQEYYTVAAACGISCCGFQVAGLVLSWGLCVRFAGCLLVWASNKICNINLCCI